MVYLEWDITSTPNCLMHPDYDLSNQHHSKRMTRVHERDLRFQMKHFIFPAKNCLNCAYDLWQQQGSTRLSLQHKYQYSSLRYLKVHVCQNKGINTFNSIWKTLLALKITRVHCQTVNKFFVVVNLYPQTVRHGYLIRIEFFPRLRKGMDVIVWSCSHYRDGPTRVHHPDRDQGGLLSNELCKVGNSWQ